MTTDRRQFLGQFTASAAMLGMMPMSLGLPSIGKKIDEFTPTTTSAEWDLSWIPKITGKHKAIFDVPEIESGYGVWRASIWVNQYKDVLGVDPKDMTPVLVIRHNAIPFVMNQAFWDKHGIGKAQKVMNPATEQPTDRNPVLLSSKKDTGFPEMFDAFALDAFLSRGGIVLACDLAFAQMVGLEQKAGNLSPEAARAAALKYMLPGVIMQPSGVFAALKAQEAGCMYLRAS